MEMLRDKNKHLERRLAELVRYGHENDSLSAKFSRWTARVIAERDPYALPRTIADGIAEVFDVPQTALRVWDVADTTASRLRAPGREVRLFTNGLSTPYCGANTGFEAQWLAPAVAAPAANAADGAEAAASAGDDSAASVALLARAPLAGNDAPAFGCSCSARPTRAASTTGWPPISSHRSRRSRAPRSRACCRTDPAARDDRRSDRRLPVEPEARQAAVGTRCAATHELDELKKLANGRPLDALTAADMRGAVARAHSGGLSARSISHRLSAWRAFYRWLAQRRDAREPGRRGARTETREDLPKALSVDDASALMDAPLANTTEGIRDHAILELFYSSGLRLAELIGLDVMYAGRRLPLDRLARPRRSRSHRARQRATRSAGAGRPQGDRCAERMARGARQFVKHDPHPLFVSVRGNRMSPGVVRERVKRAALTAGIPANVHPHVLRHSFATHVLQSAATCARCRSCSATRASPRRSLYVARLPASREDLRQRAPAREEARRRASVLPPRAATGHGRLRARPISISSCKPSPSSRPGKIAAARHPWIYANAIDRVGRAGATVIVRAHEPLPRARARTARNRRSACACGASTRTSRSTTRSSSARARSRTARRWCRARVRCGSCSAKPTGWG